MTRKELVKQRDEIFAEVVTVGRHLIDGGELRPGETHKFTYLVMLHGILCSQLKAWEETASHAHAVCNLDDALGLLTDFRLGSKPQNECVDQAREKIHAALDYLER